MGGGERETEGTQGGIFILFKQLCQILKLQVLQRLASWS